MKFVYKIAAGVASSLAVLFSGVATKYLPDELPAFSFDIFESTGVETELTQQSNKVLVPSIKTPILDGNLFIKKEFNRLVFGGVNFNEVKLSSHSRDGDVVEVLDKGENFISFQIYDIPYIEIEYKNKLYALEIFHEFLGGNDISLYYTLSTIIAVTMNLKPAKSI